MSPRTTWWFDRFHLDEEDTFDLSDARLLHSAAIALKPQRLAKAGVEEVLTLVEQTGAGARFIARAVYSPPRGLCSAYD